MTTSSGPTPTTGEATEPRFDVREAIDTGRWSPLQKGILALASLAVVLDGFDNQLLGFSVGLIAQEFAVPRGEFSWMFALGYIGVGIGTAIGGFVGDRIGRKYALILAAVAFGTFTLLTGLTTNLLTLGITRVLAGIGLGMVFPATAALIAEFTPLRRRSFAIGLSIACIPIGGLLGGLVAAPVLPILGWRILFVIGGIIPFLLVIALVAFLPESPQWQAARGRLRDRAGVVRTMSRLGYGVGPGTEFVGIRSSKRRAAIGELFAEGRARDTIGLWAAFFFGLLGVFVFYSWGPTLLVESGYDLATASLGTSVYNLGATVFAVVGAWVMGRYGSRVTLIGIAVAAILSSLWLALDTPQAGSTSAAVFIVQLLINGGCFAGLQTIFYSLAAQLYPVHVRATGVGAAGTMGRSGAILASFAGAVLLAAGGQWFFVALAVAGVAITLALLVIRNHTRPVRAQ
jgi:AAHS family 4-hydroxybenzoate transporter-like MFS transporter